MLSGQTDGQERCLQTRQSAVQVQIHGLWQEGCASGRLEIISVNSDAGCQHALALASSHTPWDWCLRAALPTAGLPAQVEAHIIDMEDEPHRKACFKKESRDGAVFWMLFHRPTIKANVAGASPAWHDFQPGHRNRCSGSLPTPNNDEENPVPRPSNLQGGPTVYRRVWSLCFLLASCTQHHSCTAAPWFQGRCYFNIHPPQLILCQDWKYSRRVGCSALLFFLRADSVSKVVIET